MEYDALVAGERFGVIRDALIARGIRAISCDMVETASPGPHIVGDWNPVISARLWPLIIIHPTCKKVTVSGNGTYAAGKPKHAERLEAAAEIERTWQFVKAHSKRAALENPVGVLPTLTRMGKPDFSIQPYDFGADASKRTCFWTHNLPPLVGTEYVPPRYVNGLPRWGNQTDSGQNRLSPSDDRDMKRAETYPGVADAIADQWGRLILQPTQAELFSTH